MGNYFDLLLNILVEALKTGKYLQSVEELGGQFQGDMVLTVEQTLNLNSPPDTTGRTGLIDTNYRWPQNLVPYELSDVFDAAQVAHIERGLGEIEAATCLRFVRRTTEVDYINVTVGKYYIEFFVFNNFVAYKGTTGRLLFIRWISRKWSTAIEFATI